MSDLFQPDDDAYHDALNSIKLLSQRDVAIHVPINFVPVPGISLATCFTGDRYELSSAVKCMSNLFAVGFRRFDLDIYWDERRYLWSFCPVQLGDIVSPTNSSLSPVTQAPSATSTAVKAEARQLLATSSASSRSFSSMQEPSSTYTLSPASSPTAGIDAAHLVEVGQYTCSPDLNLGVFLSILVSHLQATESNLNATTTYLSFNLHAARTGNNASAEAPRRLPGSDRALGSLISANASDYLYTPSNLRQQRSDLNATGSWYNVPQNVLPDSSYFQVVRQDMLQSTPDGWPTESFVTFTRYKRLLASFGIIEPEMNGYNLSFDAATIFQAGYIEQSRASAFSSSGSVQTGCIYDASSTSLQSSNNSWAVAYTQDASEQILSSQAGNLTLCGYTPVLNQTLDNTTAARNSAGYRALALKSIWSWAALEPRQDAGHCAVMNATSGNWQVEDCVTTHYRACDMGSPYDWRISTDLLSYDHMDQDCPTGSRFGVSRTALENNYLANTWQRTRSSNSISDELLWLNLNDLDLAGCWVEGQNSTCPYRQQDTNDSQAVVVPTIAGVIILVLTVITLFLKCGANRRATKVRRKRGADGIEYEGVPS